jgi:hypothetical protein
MQRVKRTRLPSVDLGRMILDVSSRIRKLAVSVLTGILGLGVAICPRSSSAQSDNGWFEPGNAPRPAATATEPPTLAPPPPSAAPPPDPSRMEPMPESPLLNQGAVAVDPDRDPRALTAWNQELAPYGTWVDDPSYGRVWIPDARVVGTNFSPYVSGGHWALDENNDWIWVSEYPFGRVVFHYGRWVWIEGRGWAWVPGLVYAPAWVTWRVPVDTYDYVGWAPIPPSYLWFGGLAVWWGYPYYYPWVFCPSAYVFYPHVHHYVVYDYDGQANAAHYTRPYAPQRDYVRQPPRGPAPSAARVPAESVPRARVSAREIAASPSPTLGVSGGPGTRRDSAGPSSRQAISPRTLTASSSAPRATPSVSPVHSQSLPSLQRSELRSSPSLERLNVGRSLPRIQPMSSPMRSAPMRMSPGAMRIPRR